MSTHAISRVPEPYNEPVRSYAPGSPEREELRRRLQQMESEQLDLPLVIGGEEVRTGDTFEAVEPHDRSHVLGTVHKGGAKEVERAIAAAADARSTSFAPPLRSEEHTSELESRLQLDCRPVLERVHRT